MEEKWQYIFAIVVAICITLYYVYETKLHNDCIVAISQSAKTIEEVKQLCKI